MNILPRTVRNYSTLEGKIPFEDWLLALKDRKARAMIRNRMNRVRLGNMGDTESVGEGVFELRIHFGPGYRLYFGELDQVIVILLCGGTKRTQRRDIERAKIYWRDLRSHGDE